MPHLTLTPFLAAQVIGFPIAFLVRAVTRLWRTRKAEPEDIRGLRMEAAANLCFALMSIAFAFARPVGVLLLVAGVGLMFAGKVPRLRRQRSQMPTVSKPPSIKNTKLAKGRKPTKLLA